MRARTSQLDCARLGISKMREIRIEPSARAINPSPAPFSIDPTNPGGQPNQDCGPAPARTILLPAPTLIFRPRTRPAFPSGGVGRGWGGLEQPRLSSHVGPHGGGAGGAGGAGSGAAGSDAAVGGAPLAGGAGGGVADGESGS